MHKKEFSAWTLICAAALGGSIATVALSGCQPPETTEPVDVSTAQGEADSNQTAGGDSNVTATGSNVTTGGPAAAVETPLQRVGQRAAEASAGRAVRLVATDAEQRDASGSRLTSTASAASVDEAVPPEEVLRSGENWPQWGGTRLRNNTPNVENLPTQWDVGSYDRRTGEWDSSDSVNLRWHADLGSQTYGNPVVADGQVYVGTNNGAGYLERYPSSVDLGCLIAFDEQSGEFLWQHSSEKLITGRVHDWPLQGICAAPLVEGDRLWFVTSRGEVRCLDTQGFRDGEDDGPVKDELARLGDIGEDQLQATAEALAQGELSDAARNLLAEAGAEVSGDVQVETIEEGKQWKANGNFGGVDRELTIQQAGPRISFFKTLGPSDKHEADTVWVLNMMDELGVSQHNMASCSVTSYGDLLFVNTSNGLDASHINLPAPKAPSFICMDKNTGEVHWTDASPGTNILHGQWSSPAVAVLGGVPQALFAGGDGWLYSFRADKGQDGKPELLWKFDCNPKESEWILGGAGTRNNLISTPVAYDGLVYLAVGQDPEHGEGGGHLWCIDPTGRGDVSPQLAVKIEEGKRTPIPHKRIQAVEPEKGEAAVDNPNSAVVWHYSQYDQNGDGEIDFEEEMHRSCGTVAIKDDVLYVADFSGLLHCLDAKGTEDGKPIVHFTYDMLAQCWGSPLIADGHVYIGDEDGEVAVLEFGPENTEPVEEIYMGSSVYSTPVAANETIFISTKDKLFALEKQE